MNEIKLKGIYEFVIKDKDGNIKDSWSVENTVTSAGKAQLALLAGDASAVPFTYLAIGTSSTAPAVGQTSLGGELTDSGLERAAATVSRTTTTVANDTLQLVYTWTASGSKTVEEAGVFNAASTGTMLSRVLTGSKVLTSSEQIMITYKISFA